MYLLGFDIGSSSIKAAIVDVGSGKEIATMQYPDKEMPIQAIKTGWAEQDPEIWWDCVCKASKQLLQSNSINSNQIQAIGIAYQMHGLVLVDQHQKVLRPSIIWCDSRAVDIGNTAFENIGQEKCLSTCLNSPGNFTASKLKWVQINEPTVYNQIHKVMLPGDFIAMKMTGEINTTISGLSEGVFWDFKKNQLSEEVFDYYQIDKSLIPNIVPTLSDQGKLTTAAAEKMGIKEGIPITYRAGDQPNNAMTLNVLKPGEVAATGGTSGVVYGVVDKPIYDLTSRVNGFAHVNHTKSDPSIGILLCLNGAGILYGWMKNQIAEEGATFNQMEAQMADIPIGADDLRILPFGNGAERMLNNVQTGASINNLQFNQHTKAHLYKASLEGIAFSFVYGMQIFNDMGINVDIIRVGNDNLFQSKVFSNTISTLMNSQIEMVQTTGAIGAARAAGVAVGTYNSLNEAMAQTKVVHLYEPILKEKEQYNQAYQNWKADLEKIAS